MDGSVLVNDGLGPDVAAAIVGVSLSAIMASALLVVLGVLWLLERLGIISPAAPDPLSPLVVSEALVTAEVAGSPSAPSAPSEERGGARASEAPERVLSSPVAGLPASRLDRPGWNVEKTARWCGQVVASGRDVDLQQLAPLIAIIPREWMC